MTNLTWLIVTCDFPGCAALIEVEQHPQAWTHDAEQRAINAGWTLSQQGEGKDYCPEHDLTLA